MKVVALVSGGKDSCFNMVLCRHYGHDTVALANLLPPQSEIDDLDSYMYQTVGHQVIAAYSKCMGLPLYRRRITGASKDQRLVYEDTAGDEVEDLVALLAFIKQQMPEIEAVSSGAIASDYQRTRVERVCARLGLVSLAYLWHQPQDRLLQRMIDAEIEAVLVKIAAAGLHPRRHLGASLASVQPHLRSLRETFGCNVCGEGGEYETLTLDCPLFTQGRIVLDRWETVMVSEDSMAPVALLHPTEFHIEEKNSDVVEARREEGVVIEVPDDYLYIPDTQEHTQSEEKEEEEEGTSNRKTTIKKVVGGGGYQTLTAQVCIQNEGNSQDDPSTTVDAITEALNALSDELKTQNVSWNDALFVHLYVPAMSHFAAANTAYSSFLPAINPPSRACIQLAPGLEASLVVEVLLSRAEEAVLEKKKVLHVQSISEWAPSCIGPYSQAVAHRGMVYFAGQIPLDPPTMTVLAPNDIKAGTARSLMSAQAVAVAMRTNLTKASLWWTIYCSAQPSIEEREAAADILQTFLAGKLNSNEEDNNEEEDDVIDDYLLPPSMHRHWDPQITFVVVPELPRGVLIEVEPVAWSMYGTAPESSSSSSSDEEGTSRRRRRFNTNNDDSPRWVAEIESKKIEENNQFEVDILASPGNFFHASVFMKAEGSESAINAAIEAVKKEMASRLFTVADTVAANLYMPVSNAAKDVQNWVEASLGVQTAVVPVLQVGNSATADNALAIEISLRK